jgi:membrane protease subunit (stomatin/prohibitin family)
MARKLVEKLTQDLSHFGLGLRHLYINAITPPPDVQQAIDDRSRMGAIQDMNKLMQMKAAMAFEKAASGDAAAGQAMGTGLGLMMPAMFAPTMQALASFSPRAPEAPATPGCPECGHPIPTDARFCPQCGHQQLVLIQCGSCGKNLTPKDRFCSRCGKPVDIPPASRTCPECGSENLAGSIFCNQCGGKIPE